MPSIPKAIEDSQQVVAEHNPHPYYEVYRPTETGYWGNIPKWISELSPSPKTILDIGCAYGTLLVFCRVFHNCDLYAVDVHPYISRELISVYSIKCCLGFNIEVDIFPWWQKFDLILFTEVFEHLECRPEITLVKLGNLLTPKGKILLSTPNQPNYGGPARNDYPEVEDIPFVFDPNRCPEKERHSHHYLYNEEELRKIVYNSGLCFERLEGQEEKHLIASLVKDEDRWVSHHLQRCYPAKVREAMPYSSGKENLDG